MKLIGRYKAKVYQTYRGISPYKIWFEKQQITSRARFETRLMNIEDGNIGDHRWVGDGVWELKFHFGPGYRIYFGVEGRNIIILLSGGEKNLQQKDIKKAKEFWSDYLSRKED